MTNVSTILAAFSCQLSTADIPLAVLERAKLLITDSVGIAIRAWHDVDSTTCHVAALETLGQVGGPCSVFGSGRRFSAPSAAELNGALIHSLDFDDTYAPGALHPSATVLPAALAAAQMEGASGSQLLNAVIVGYESVCRLSVALNAGDHYDRGFHPTATCGAFAAALAAAKILRLDQNQTEAALGIALSQTSGSLQFLANGAWTKRFQVGNAARAGLVSAYLAREGYVGAAQPVEGKHGFLRAYAPHAQAEQAVLELGSSWRTLEIAVKPYPACRFSHAAVDAILALRREHAFALENIEQVLCGLPHKGILLVGEPIAQKRQVATVVEGQFSMPFAAAVALLDGQLIWDSYARRIGDPAVEALMQKVDVETDPAVEALFPERFGARVRIGLSNGHTLQKLVNSPKGEADNFPSPEELKQKFDGLTSPYLSVEQGQDVLHLIRNLERAATIDAIFP